MLRSNSYRGDRMDYHHHARLTIYRREELAETVIQGRLSLKEAAAEFKLSRQSAAKWVRRFRTEKQPGLRDRSSRPPPSPPSPSPELSDRVQRLRRERWTGVRIADRSRRDDVDANPAWAQFGRKNSRHGADPRLTRRVRRIAGRAASGDDRAVEDDRGAVTQQRQSALHGKERADYVGPNN